MTDITDRTNTACDRIMTAANSAFYFNTFHEFCAAMQGLSPADAYLAWCAHEILKQDEIASCNDT